MEANTMNNRHAEVWAYLALLALQAGQPQEAEQALKWALRCELGNAQLLDEIGEQYMKAARYAFVLTPSTCASTCLKPHSNAPTLLGVLATQHHTALLCMRGLWIKCYYKLLCTLVQFVCRYQDACKAFQQAIAVQDKPHSRWLLGDALHEIGALHEAQSQYEAVLQNDRSTEAEQVHVRSQLAAIHRKVGLRQKSA